jgi:uncharacterized membrane protein YccC
MTQQQETASAASASRQRTPGTGSGQAVPWWRVTWSLPAALRAVRATIVIPVLFALTDKVIVNEQMTIFAVFGGFGALVMTSFGGGRRDKALAHLGLAVAGSVMIIVGTLVSGSAWLAAVVTVPLAFTVFFAGSSGPTAASGVTACLLAYVLPVASAGTASMLPSRLEGWWLAQAAATIAVLVLSSRSPGDRLRALASALAGGLASELDAALRGAAADEDRRNSLRARQELQNAFNSTPYRPIGLASADQALASLVHLLDWLTSLIAEVIDGHVNLHEAARPEKDLLAESAVALGQVAALLGGHAAAPDLERLWRLRRASARHLHEFSGEPAAAAVMTDQAFHAQAIGVAATAAVGEALVAAGLARPDDVTAKYERWLNGHEDSGHPARSGLVGYLRPVVRTAAIVAADASLRSVWFRNSARGAIALAAAVAVAKLIDVEHAFWVVLGTLSVLRTSAASTGSTALRALVGTIVGFAIGAVLMLAIGTNPTVLWAVFPLVVLIAAYTPGTAPFAVGQAAFTITIIVLFNIIVPAGWRVGLLRVEDVAIGCAVSLVVGVLFWPRGTSSVVGDNLADAFRAGAGYLTGATGWALGQRSQRPQLAFDATSAGGRLDDALRGYLTEQGSKRVTKADLWTLAMAATRLRLTANSLASLPGEALPAGRPTGEDADALLAGQAAQLSQFYDDVAVQVGRPGHDAQATLVIPRLRDLDGSQAADGKPGYSPEALWVSHHLAHLSTHLQEVAGPAERLARLRRRAWWH